MVRDRGPSLGARVLAHHLPHTLQQPCAGACFTARSQGVGESADFSKSLDIPGWNQVRPIPRHPATSRVTGRDRCQAGGAFLGSCRL